MMRRTFIVLAIALCGLTAQVRAAEYFVATNGNDGATGTNWASALLTISNAVFGDIWVVSAGEGAGKAGGLAAAARAALRRFFPPLCTPATHRHPPPSNLHRAPPQF